MEHKFMSEPALDAKGMTCPHCGEKERIWIHSQKERRLRCGTCHHTFAETTGAPLFDLHDPPWVVILGVGVSCWGQDKAAHVPNDAAVARAICNVRGTGPTARPYP